MAFEIEFFRRSASHPQGEVIGPRRGGFASRRAARTIAERRRPPQADGFRIFADGALLISIDFDPARGIGSVQGSDDAGSRSLRDRSAGAD